MPRLRTLVARTALVGLAFTAFRAQGASPPVTVSLRSSFIASDPLLEALECVAMEDSSVLFPLLSAFPLPEALHKPRDAHTAVFDLASTLLDPASLASARARLALHAASPRLAASAEHYDLRVTGILDHVGLECASWVDWYGQVVCDAESLLRLANAPTTEDIDTKPRRLPFDHTHTLRLSLDEPLYTVIHYADPTAPSFASLHTALLSLEPKVEYILRWARGAGNQKVGELSNYLSGYGVALDLKKMDYLVLDDRNQNLGNRQLDSSESDRSREGRVETENRTPEEILSCIFESLPYTDELAEARARAGEPLSTEEVASLGVKAVQFLASVSSQPWIGSYVRQCWDSHKLEPPAIETVFRTLSTSFPLYATSLARKVQLTDEVNDEVLENWAKASPGVNMVWVNGRVLNEDQGGSGNIFGLLPTLQRERTLVKSLVQLGLTQEQAIELLMAPAHSSPELAVSQAGASAKRPTTRGSAKAFAVQNSENSPQDGEERPKKSFTLTPKVAEFLDGLVDASDRQEGGNVILWLNDLEKDPRYRRFLPSLTGLLRVHAMSLFSPALRLRHNLINAVFVVDLSQLRSLSMLSNLQDNFVLHGYPVRWGFVPETGDDSFKMARLMCYLEHKYGKDMMIDFIQEVLALHGQRSQMTLSWGTVHDVFHALNVTEDFISVTSADAPVGDKSAGDDLLVRTQRYNKRLGVTAQGESGKGHVFVNGRYFPLSDNIMRQVANEAAIQLQILQEMVHIGEITDADSPVMSTFFYDLPSTMSRRNPYIFTKSGGGQGSDGQRLTIFNLAEVFSTVGFTLKDGSFVVPSKEPNSVLPLSMYIIADLDMLEGAELVSEALTFGSRSVDTRLTFVHNPATSGSVTGGGTAELLTTLIQAGTLSNISPSRLRAALVGEGEESLFDIMQNQLLASEGTDVSGLLQTMRLLVRQLGLQPGERAILVNGRLVGPFELGTEFLAEDMEMLEGFELTRRVGQIMGALDGVLDGEDVFDTQERTNLIAVASSIIYADQQPDPSEVGLFDTAPRPRSRNYRLLSGDYT
ncbi:hypothetical protein ID866_8172 [Astraeus odoratus]|nr:hypothetical protein ID866_8172 [Astraeus odoratus]